MKEGNKKTERSAQVLLIIGIAAAMVFGFMVQTYSAAKWVVRSHHPVAAIVMEAADRIGVDTQKLVQAVSAVGAVENTVRSAIHYSISGVAHWNHPLVLANDLYHLWQVASTATTWR